MRLLLLAELVQPKNYFYKYLHNLVNIDVIYGPPNTSIEVLPDRF